MLSKAKHLLLIEQIGTSRSFAEFILSAAEGLRMTPKQARDRKHV